jgi:methanol--5-hydroxybenzimidazolylcobamide Co-methyltransferase
MLTADTLAVPNASDLVFGTAPRPVSLAPGITLGVGTTFPEINYMLPHGTKVCAETLDDVVGLYRKMAEESLQRAFELSMPALVIEIELVYELTLHPEWGAQVMAATREVMEAYETKGVHSALRATIADIRERCRPPRNRTSEETDIVLASFTQCAPYADVLSIESTGGKEISDDAILQCDPAGALFAMGELASRDMAFLWERIVQISAEHDCIPGGDTACGFANTAMQLARKGMIPTVFAAFMRALGASRSLVAVEQGAVGPTKDCGYEGPVLKAITGIPIAMEGKSAACAHSSHLGNVAMCCCDLWSNESVPYTQLFGGTTPEVMLEQLWYDCKLMNEATANGTAHVLRDTLVASDVRDSAEALMLSPESTLRLARAIGSTEAYGPRTVCAARESIAIMKEAVAEGALTVPDVERAWLERLETGVDQYDALGEAVGEYVDSMYPNRYLPDEYGL